MRNEPQYIVIFKLKAKHLFHLKKQQQACTVLDLLFCLSTLWSVVELISLLILASP